MKKKTIEVIIGPTGAITIEAKEFKGRGCEEATRFLEESLGSVKERKKKPEYHQIQATGSGINQQQGT